MCFFLLLDETDNCVYYLNAREYRDDTMCVCPYQLRGSNSDGVDGGGGGGGSVMV